MYKANNSENEKSFIKHFFPVNSMCFACAQINFIDSMK